MGSFQICSRPSKWCLIRSSSASVHLKIRPPDKIREKNLQPVTTKAHKIRIIWAISGDYGIFRPPWTHSSNAHAQPSSGDRCLIFVQTLRLLPYCMSANSEGSGETAWMRRLAWAFAGRTKISWAGSYGVPFFRMNEHSELAYTYYNTAWE